MARGPYLTRSHAQADADASPVLPLDEAVERLGIPFAAFDRSVLTSVTDPAAAQSLLALIERATRLGARAGIYAGSPR